MSTVFETLAPTDQSSVVDRHAIYGDLIVFCTTIIPEGFKQLALTTSTSFLQLSITTCVFIFRRDTIYFILLLAILTICMYAIVILDIILFKRQRSNLNVYSMLINFIKLCNCDLLTIYTQRAIRPFTRIPKVTMEFSPELLNTNIYSMIAPLALAQLPYAKSDIADFTLRVGCTLVSMSDAKSTKGLVSSILMFVSAYFSTGDPRIPVLKAHLTKIWHNVSFSTFRLQADYEDVSTLDKVSSLLETLSGLDNTAMYSALVRSVYLLAVLPGDLSKETFEEYATSVSVKSIDETSKPKLVLETLNQLLKLYKYGSQYFEGGCSLLAFIHCEDTYSDWYDQSCKVLHFMNNYLTTSEIAPIHEYRAKTQKLIEEGETIVRKQMKLRSGKPPPGMGEITRMIDRLRSSDATLVKHIDDVKSRITPMGILIYGPPFAGKSQVVSMVIAAYAKVKDLKDATHLVYNRTQGETYMSGLLSSDRIYIYDELGASADKSVASAIFNEILTIISSIFYNPNMAAIEEKGAVSANPDIVIATSNHASLNAKVVSYAPAAILRRFPLTIEVRAKAEFRAETGSSLDQAKISAYLATHAGYTDFSEYQLRKVRPNGNINVDEEDVFPDFVSKKVVFEYVVNYLDEYYKNQNKIMGNTYNIHDQGACHCPKQYPISVCEVCTAVYQELGIELRSEAITYLRGPDSVFKTRLESLGGPPLPSADETVIEPTMRRKAVEYMTEKSRAARDKVQALGRSAFERMDEEYTFYNMRSNQMFSSFGGVLGGLILLYTAHRLKKKYLDNEPNKAPITSVPVVVLPKPTIATQSPSVKPILSGNFVPNGQKAPPTQKLTLSKCGNYGTYEVPLDSVRDLHNMHDTHFLALLGQSLTQITIEITGGKCYIAPYYGPWWIIPYHLLQGMSGDDHTKVTLKSAKVDVEATICVRDILRPIEGGDLCLLHLPCLGPQRDFTKYYTDSHAVIQHNNFAQAGCRAALVQSYENGEDLTTYPISWERVTYKVDKLEVNTMGVTYAFDGKPGDCGRPLVLLSPNARRYMIAGLHTGMIDNIAFAEMLDRDRFIGAIAHYNTTECPTFFPQADIPLQNDVGMLHPKSPFAKIPSNINVYGTDKTYVRGKSKSSVRETILEPHMSVFFPGEKHKFHGPMMNPGMKGGKWVDSFYEGMKHCAAPITIPPSSIVTHVANITANHYCSLLVEQQKTAKPLTLEEAVNGIDGHPHIRSLNMNTSMGYPYQGSKKSMAHQVPGKREGFMEFDRCVYDEIAAIKSCYAKGYRYSPIFNTYNKDEPTQKDVARTFACAPVAFNILLRQYFLPIIAIMREDPLHFCNMVGTNQRSSSWEDLFKHLTKHGLDQIVAGDYSKFDKHQGCLYIWHAMMILIKMGAVLGYPTSAIQIMAGLASDLVSVVYNIGGDFASFFGSNPSGHSLTVEINSIVNILYIMMAYTYCGYDATEFFLKVALATYGDDNIMGVSKDRPNFNHTTIAEILSALGIKYTMADKTSKSVPFINIFDAEFLKRKFRQAKSGAMYAPLAKKSIYKMLCYRTKSDLSDVQHAIGNINGALIEARAHGPAFLNELRECCDTIDGDVLPRSLLEKYMLSDADIEEYYIQMSGGVVE